MEHSKTAAEAGWHYSRYNLFARVPGKDLIVWINTLQGRCSEYSVREYALMTQILSFPETHPLIPHYRDRGIITNQDEKELLKEIYRDSSAKTVTLTICPTMGCNFDCPYCFEKHIPGLMSEKVRDDIVSLAEKMMTDSGAKTLSVLWFGGEPLLGLNIIESLSKRLIETAASHNAQYTAELITNGYLLNDHASEVLEQARVHNVQITLDGMKEAHDRTRYLAGGGGTFDVIINNLRRKLPFHIKIRHNVTESNREEEKPLEQFIADLKQKTGNDLSFYTAAVFASEAAEERGKEIRYLCAEEGEELSFDLAAEEFRKKSPGLCDACRKYSVTVDPEGKLYCCCAKAGDPNEFYGMVHTFDPLRPVETAVCPEIQEFYKNTDLLFEGKCGDCVFLPQCSGMCVSERRKGDLNCPYYADHPREYVLGIYRYLKEKQKQEEKAS